VTLSNSIGLFPQPIDTNMASPSMPFRNQNPDNRAKNIQLHPLSDRTI
jgi:hypothetical protein